MHYLKCPLQKSFSGEIYNEFGETLIVRDSLPQAAQ